ncbi:Acyl-CoA reductase (LuxC) [Modestobacter sp. DSM 44400]|uniref:acyl-CoA reductase n=1 Tax=Modestobacter sp. DSM 44400 TaxID=1550230 RepID=UPI00089430AE|nr:acyl-CoA reductase [Modestobacter sp. DSM 44400]SDY57760.1 Acyl-CoA reductase (LuxC) [Modestobacter sp. DSM 44400]
MTADPVVDDLDSSRAEVLDSFFLPQLTAPELGGLTWVTRRVDGGGGAVLLRSPVLTPDVVELVCDRLLAAQAAVLADRPVMDIAEVVGRAVARWYDPDHPGRRLAERLLPQITGYAPDMVRRGLKDHLKTFRADRLLRFLAADFDNPLVLDGFQPNRAGGRSRAFGPRLTTQVFAGNVPGLPAWNIICALLVKSATLGKSASGEPLFPVLLARSLAEEDPDLGRCLAVAPWPGGAADVEAAAFARSDAVTVTGGQAAVQSVTARVPTGVPVIAYGHKVSFAVVGREALALNRYPDTARRVARDVSQYDQQGCLSPHVVFVERDGGVDPQTFSAALAGEMARFEVTRPRARLGLADSAAIEQVRAQYEFRSYDDAAGVALFASDGTTAWTVVHEERPAAFTLSPLNRVVRVHPVSDVAELEPLLAPVRRYLQTAGVACAPERLTGWAEVLGRCGVDRICAVGQMPDPAAGWHHDGRGSLAALVRWVDIEGAAELTMESYDPEWTRPGAASGTRNGREGL